jgi:nitrogen fixation protein NifU and related proteins
MPLSDDLSRKRMLEHYHRPRNHGILENPSAVVEAVNRVCGDELTLYLHVENNIIKDIKLTVKGCSINVASGSMMSEAIMGLSVEQASKIVESFKHMMTGNEKTIVLPDGIEELESLQEVKKYPVRIKCALLPWNAFVEAIKIAEQAADVPYQQLVMATSK